ncbi:MAG: 2-oxo acid dehydrogenase subunit E2 [Xanthomonadales bacterium]|nr:2-oxo acid dehydrogenase subunit E2 [Xanthomonadales bacterium]
MSDYIFKLPDLGEGTVEAEIAEWMVQVGALVKEEDPICSMLTDKAAVELSSPVSGRVVSLAGEVGDSVPVGSPLITFAIEAAAPASGTGDDKKTADATREAVPASVPGKTQSAPAANEKARTSPSIRQRAREAGVNLSDVAGSGPGGRILKQDLDAFLAGNTPLTAQVAALPVAALPLANGKNATTETKVVGLRRKIAQRMEQANSEVPHFSYVEEVDITALESLRSLLNQGRAAERGTLTLLPFISMALTRVLRDFPQCNSHYDRERNVLIRHEAVHLGIATQTADGLKVPVVRQAQERQLEDMATEIRRVSEAARDNSASREELGGSTITLTSLGKLGGVVSTPIINLPEVAIIGVNKAVQRPMVVNGQIVIRTMMNLSSSFDHRFVDGYDAAAMIQALKLLLEQPASLVLQP